MSIEQMCEIPAAARRYVDAVNAFDVEAVLAALTPDALVHDNQREFTTPDAIRAWVRDEIVGDRVTMQVIEVVERSGVTVLRARYDGDYDKTNLPEELILTNYIVTREDLIAALFTVFNKS
ncbi:nuclear transport factor 2 family protein [Mycobacterium sp. DL99]|uniref:nuclear transport factor 2 family protein n=1 Tax=Mycobacterium sp. DL99 TaxID=2528957 RepID=UPI001AEBD350|nr:nuclear transport factor 2 family protein [Mycobacterium sp. DL99]